MECVGTEIGLRYLWYCFDVPNWLTLLVEVIVAGLLGLLFYRLTNRYYNEIKKNKNEKHVTAMHTIGNHVHIIYAIIMTLKELAAELGENGLATLNHKESKGYQLELDENTEKINELLNFYSEVLSASELEIITGLSVIVEDLAGSPILFMKESITASEVIFTKIARMTNYMPLKMNLGLTKKSDASIKW